MTRIQEMVERLWLATKHGDEDHQAWLRDAYAAFFSGRAVPEPRGRGNKEARIAELESQLAGVVGERDALLRRAAEHLRSWAELHPMDATAETWAILHCIAALSPNQGAKL